MAEQSTPRNALQVMDDERVEQISHAALQIQAWLKLLKEHVDELGQTAEDEHDRLLVIPTMFNRIGALCSGIYMAAEGHDHTNAEVLRIMEGR